MTLGQLSDSSLEVVTSLIDSVDVLKLERDKEEKNDKKTMKKPRTKQETFKSDILPRIIRQVDFNLSSPMLDEYKLDVVEYFEFFRKLRGGDLLNESVESILAYLDGIELSTQRLLLMITANKRYFLQTMKEQYTQDFKQLLKRHGYCYHTIMIYMNLYELLDYYPVLTVSGLTLTEFCVYRTMIIDHMNVGGRLDSKCRQNLKHLKKYP